MVPKWSIELLIVVSHLEIWSVFVMAMTFREDRKSYKHILQCKKMFIHTGLSEYFFHKSKVVFRYSGAENVPLQTILKAI